MFRNSALVAGSLAVADAKQALVFIGATGDNALRENGVWQGLFEAFAGGEFEDGVGIHVAMNTPHTEAELKSDVMETLAPLYADLQKNSGWSCNTADGDCSPEKLYSNVQVDIHAGRDSCAQTDHMAPSLADYEKITMYLSIPPKYFGNWVECGIKSWGDRVHAAAEKPFGVSTEEATQLHQTFADGGLTDDKLHLVDHWLSFFMNKNLPVFRKLVEPSLGITFNKDTIGKVIVKENEVRGLDGRGGFIDTVGQVRDMVQSHLLQVLGLALIDPASTSRSDAKLAMFKNTEVDNCCFGQYKDFVLEPKLTFHGDFADATWCDVKFNVNTPEWTGVPVHVVTGKDMGELVYTVELHQKDGNGVLTFEVGKEETGVAGVKVANWPLVDDSELIVPAGGFDVTKTITVKPAVVDGTGYIINYDMADMYFPKPYSVMAGALLTGNYEQSFVTWAECLRSWEIVTSSGPEVCLDPAPENVEVYRSPLEEGSECLQNEGSDENVCWQAPTVKDLYDVQFECTAAHDVQYANISLYQAKCHSGSALSV